MRFFITLLVLIVVAASAKNYDGYKVYRVHPSNEDQARTLSNLSGIEHFDFWSPIRHDGKPIDVMVDNQTADIFAGFLNKYEIAHEILIENVQSVFEDEAIQQLKSARTQPGDISFSKYNSHGEINAYLDKLTVDHSNIVTVETIGKSYEGNDLKLIKISTDPSATKTIIFIDAGIHAREWISPAQAIYIIQQLVENSTNSNLLEKIDWHILPVVNPDGYEFSQADDRLWRKTRWVGLLCRGVDANRNFGFHWGEEGASPHECDGNYRGDGPFSEPETSAVRDYILKHKEHIKLYLTFHSYGNYILYPWGYTSALPANSDELQMLGQSVAKKIAAVRDTDYTVGSSTNVLYPTAGGSDDWAKGGAGIELSYTIELPGGGFWGFDLPPSQILPVVSETWEGVVEFHDYIANKFR